MRANRLFQTRQALGVGEAHVLAGQVPAESRPGVKATCSVSMKCCQNA